MYCKNCGEKINKDSRFCTKCGMTVEKETEKNIVEEAAKSQVSSEKPIEKQALAKKTVAEKTDVKALDKKLKKPKKWKYIVTIILICGLWGWFLRNTALEQTMPLKDFFIRAAVITGVLLLIFFKYLISESFYKRRKEKNAAAVLLVMCIILMQFIGSPKAFAEELNIDEMVNLGTIHLSMILDSNNYELEPNRAFNFNNFRSEFNGSVRDLYIYEASSVLSKDGMRLNVKVYRSADSDTAKSYFQKYIEDNKPIDYALTGTSKRDPALFLDINHDSNIIKQTDTEFFAFNHDELIREWYPGSDGVAPMMSTVRIMPTNQNTPSIFDYDESKVGSSGEDEMGPFVYGETYDQAGASCEMQYVFFVKDNIFAVVSAYGTGGVRTPEDQMTKEHVVKMINDLITKVQPVVESTKEEIANNFRDIDLDKEGLITGNVATFKPIVNARMALYLKDGNKYETTTDSSGNFIFDTGKSDQEILKIGTGEITLYLSYNTEKENFRIVYGDEVIKLTSQVEFENINDMDIKMLSISPKKMLGNVAINSNDDINMVTAFYIHTAEAYEFYRDILGYDVSKDRDQKDPITIFVMGEGNSAFYSGADENIYIPMARSPYNHPNRPMNREWHEFSHLAMEAIYGKFPEGYTDSELSVFKDNDDIKTTYSKNHMGFKNNSTADSFVEGFAEFIPMVMAKHYSYPAPHIYPAGVGSLEANKIALAALGQDEELAIAGILWDLIDSDDDYKGGIDDERVVIPFEEIWDILKTYKANFNDVYDELIVKYGGNEKLSKNIDTIFIRHAFVNFDSDGDGTREAYEPYFDGIAKAGQSASLDKTYNDGEEFVDYPYEPGFQEGDVPGSPADQERLYRKEAVIPDGYYIHPGTCENDYYGVYVDFPEIPHFSYYVRTTVDENGLVPIAFPPEQYQATIQISSGAGEPLSIENSDFYAAYGNSVEQGYYIKYDFENSDSDEYNIPETEIKPVNYDTGFNIPFYEMVELAADENRDYEDLKKEYTEKNSGKAEQISSVPGNDNDSDKTGNTGPGISGGVKGFMAKAGYMSVYGMPIILGLLIIILIIKKK